jgi:uncharacterized protein YyaL (SSP411 family)
MVRLEPSDQVHETDPDGKRQANHLIFEKSPYLIQHAHNPVDWYPWGDEAFERAIREDKPVFLSIGYATCHWCHVMAHESFEDEAVARHLNDSFISIKVDREERPDIDSVYMAVCQIMTGTGGWPLTIVMTPDRKPFFAGTYLPREGRFTMAGLLDLLPGISNLWRERRSDLIRSAEEISNALLSPTHSGGTPVLDEWVLASAYEDLLIRFDNEYGGFGSAPKFPSPHVLMFLLRYWSRTGNSRALAMVTKTLDEIRMGGMYDQIGFGVHRYSTDARWRVPHFAKMLYDQALLAMAYTEAYQATKNSRYRRTAEEILGYILRDMISPEGAFYSAEDADSEGREGAFYVWTAADLERVLGREDAALTRAVFCVTGSGEYSNPLSGNTNTILRYTSALDGVARKHQMTVDELASKIETIRSTLFLARQVRPRPERDDKVLADWNGFTIAALAKAAQAFGEQKYAGAGRRAARFILKVMRTPDGGLFHRYRDGEAAIPAFGDDYTSMVWGLIELYEATFEDNYLTTALELNRYFMTHFLDREVGGFFMTADTSEQLLVRKKEVHDGATPSCNSVALLNLLRLARVPGEHRLEKTASELSEFFSATVQGSPFAYTFFLCALDYAIGPSREVVITGDLQQDGTQALIDVCHTHFLPSVILIFQPAGGSNTTPFNMLESTGYHAIGGKATAYVCSRHACELPITNPDDLLAVLRGRQSDSSHVR